MQKVKIEPFKLVGIAVETTNENNKAAKDIEELWVRFMQQDLISRIPNRVDDTVFSVYTGYKKDHMAPDTAVLGCKVTNFDHLPEGLVGKDFDGGTYVKTTAKGNLMDNLIVDHWSQVWSMDLDRAFTADFEVFGQKAQNPEMAEVDFYVAVIE